MSATQNMLDAFFLPEDQDAFARSQGWEDAAQMVYYTDLIEKEQAQNLHELDKVDSREAFSDDALEYWAGVY